MVPTIPDELNYGLWDKISGLTLVQSTTDAYSSMRASNWLLNTGMGMMEKGVSLGTSPALSALLFVVKKCPQKVTTLDKLACNYLDMFEVGFTVAHGSAEQIAHGIKSSLQDAALKTARKTCSSSPGKLVLTGLEVIVKASERALDYINEEYVINNKKRSDVTAANDVKPEMTPKVAPQPHVEVETPEVEVVESEPGQEEQGAKSEAETKKDNA